MALTKNEVFMVEWAKVCFKLNPTVENKKRLNDANKMLKERLKCSSK